MIHDVLSLRRPERVVEAGREARLRVVPRRVQYIPAVLRRALGRAVRWGWTSRNVATLVDPPRIRRHEIKPLSPEEIRKLLGALEGERLGALYVLALTTGIRQGELLALRWRDVDLASGAVMIRRSLQRLNGVVEFVEPKTERNRRTVPVPAFACAVLAQHRDDQDRERAAAGARWQAADDLVLCTARGLPLHGSTNTHQFHRFLERAEIERRRFHDLRHSTATVLMGEGRS